MSGSAEVSPRMGLVLFAFGAAAVPFQGHLPGGQLPGSALLQLLADLGLSQSASRSLLLRMRREDWLESERHGGGRYRLAPAVHSAQARIERQLRGQRPPWPGFFSGALYEIPEDARAYRDRLRRTGQLLGYATLRPGLMIAATDRWAELGALLPAQPPGSQLLRIEVRLDAGDTRAVAARLWGLDALAARYRLVLAQTRALTAQAASMLPEPERSAPSRRRRCLSTMPRRMTRTCPPTCCQTAGPAASWPARSARPCGPSTR